MNGAECTVCRYGHYVAISYIHSHIIHTAVYTSQATIVFICSTQALRSQAASGIQLVNTSTSSINTIEYIHEYRGLHTYLHRKYQNNPMNACNQNLEEVGVGQNLESNEQHERLCPNGSQSIPALHSGVHHTQ